MFRQIKCILFIPWSTKEKDTWRQPHLSHTRLSNSTSAHSWPSQLASPRSHGQMFNIITEMTMQERIHNPNSLTVQDIQGSVCLLSLSVCVCVCVTFLLSQNFLSREKSTTSNVSWCVQCKHSSYDWFQGINNLTVSYVG